MAKGIIVALAGVVLFAIITAAFVVWRYPMSVFNWNNRRALAAAGFQKIQLSTPVGTQTMWEAGSGPLLLFLHGAGDHAGSWSKVAPAFTSQYHVVVPDLAGHAESAPSSGPLHIATVLAGVEAVISARASGQPVTIVGNSLGAWLGVLYAHEHPEKVSHLILTGGGPLRGERPDLIQVPRTRGEMTKMFDAILDSGTPKPAGFVLDHLVREAQHGPIGRMAETGAPELERYLLEGKLQGIRTPIDLVWGESDKLVPLTFAMRMEQQLPAVRLTTLPRCGHIPQQECPMAYIQTLQRVLSEAPPQPKSQATLVSGSN